MVDTPQVQPAAQHEPAGPSAAPASPAPETPGAHDWILPAEGGTPPDDVVSGGTGSRRTALLGAGLVLAGVVGGAGVAFALDGHHGSTTTFRQAAQNGFGQPPGTGQGGTTQGGATGGPQDGRGFGGPGGGLDGEQRVTGTLTAVGSSSVTVRTSSGTATYRVTSSSQILRDGAPATLAQLRTGEQVLVHVYPASSGSATLLVERLFAGTLPTGPGGPPPGAQQSGANPT